MYVFEMKKLPTKADKALLEWDSGMNAPERNRANIGLPRNPSAEFYSLRNGNQFLYRTGNRMWFGGTDEEPFLVEMDPKLIGTYVQSQGSDDALYRELVPESILKITSEVSPTRSYRRQGDIFAARFCGEQYFEKNLSFMVRTSVRRGEFNVLGTRHVGLGTGLWINEESRQGDLRGNVLFRGVIQAPDHHPLELNDAFYMLGQTRHIINPTNAD